MTLKCPHNYITFQGLSALSNNNVLPIGDETYTPRLICFDLKGSLNTLKQEGELYELPEQEQPISATWQDDITLHEINYSKKNNFLKSLEVEENQLPKHSLGKNESKEEMEIDSQSFDNNLKIPQDSDLDLEVKVWSDFLRPHFHPRSIHIIKEFTHNDESCLFDLYQQGKQLFSMGDNHYEIDDKLHYFLEECDHIQGLQLITNTHDGFSGLSSSVLNQLRDDMGKVSIFTFGVSPSFIPKTSLSQEGYFAFNQLFSFESLMEQSSAFCPLSLSSNPFQDSVKSIEFQGLSYKHQSQYHSSAILGSCLDTATIPYRLSDNIAYLYNITDSLTTQSRKMLSLQAWFPVHLTHNSFSMTLEHCTNQLPWKPITPMCLPTPDLQSVVIRGISDDRIISKDNKVQIKSGVEETISHYINNLYPSANSAITFMRHPLSTRAPFPPILSEPEKEKITTGHEFCSSLMTNLQNSKSIQHYLDYILTKVKKVKLAKFPKIFNDNFEFDDYISILHNFENIVEGYR